MTDPIDQDQAATHEEFLRASRRWGRWGVDDQRGAVNLIDEIKRREAANGVRSGRVVSLSRTVATAPAPDNPRPAHHFMRRTHEFAADYVGVDFHGRASTHLDALCHVFDEDGRVWNGRDASDVITMEGATWGGVEQWRDGLVTRAVLLDVPRHRGEDYVTVDRPVTADELRDIVRSEELSITPGDAVIVYSGRERWDAAEGVWGTDVDESGRMRRPGLDPSCSRFLAEVDCAVLGWDMMDAMPYTAAGMASTVHGTIHALGLALIDNCSLGELAEACSEEGRLDFMLIASPLVVVGGTGSPVNPLALF